MGALSRETKQMPGGTKKSASSGQINFSKKAPSSSTKNPDTDHKTDWSTGSASTPNKTPVDMFVVRKSGAKATSKTVDKGAPKVDKDAPSSTPKRSNPDKVVHPSPGSKNTKHKAGGASLKESPNVSGRISFQFVSKKKTAKKPQADPKQSSDEAVKSGTFKPVSLPLYPPPRPLPNESQLAPELDLNLEGADLRETDTAIWRALVFSELHGSLLGPINNAVFSVPLTICQEGKGYHANILPSSTDETLGTTDKCSVLRLVLLVAIEYPASSEAAIHCLLRIM